MKLTTVVITAGHADWDTVFRTADIAAKGSRTVLWANHELGAVNAPWVVRTGPNVGNYPVYHACAELLDSDLLFFIHDDFIIHEEGYDQRLIEAFRDDPKLGLVGVIGSPEFDAMGGRGFLSFSNFQGKSGGSPAEAHGHRFAGFMPAASVDGCALCFRRDFLLELPVKEGFPPHHFYDRLFSAQMLERGHRVGLLGIACDHLSGRTSCSFEGWDTLAREWCEANGVFREGTNGWDHQIYLEAEAQFLAEYRDEKRFIPLRVGVDHTVYHTHPKRGLAA